MQRIGVPVTALEKIPILRTDICAFAQLKAQAILVRVAAVVELRPGTQVSLEELQQHCRRHVAGYKVPRQLNLVDELVRSPAGKPDYEWAKRIAVSPQSEQAAHA